MGKIYNEEYKEAFIETLNLSEGSKKQYISMFRRASLEEIKLDKDLFDMYFNELEIVFRASKRSTPQSMIAYVGVIKSYIDWAKKNGYSVDSENPIVETVNEDFVSKYLFKLGHKYYTREQVINVIDKMVNYRDKAFALSVFEGFFGNKMSDLINLRYEDLEVEDDKYYVTIINHDTGEPQRKQISEMLYRLFCGTYEETSIVSPTGGIQKVTEGEYVFRRTRTSKDGDCKTTTLYFHTLGRKLLKHAFGSNKVSMSTLRVSGIMHRMNELMDDKREFTREMANVVITEYNLPTVRTEDGSTPYYTSLKRIIDMEWLSETYGDFELKF